MGEHFLPFFACFMEDMNNCCVITHFYWRTLAPDQGCISQLHQKPALSLHHSGFGRRLNPPPEHNRKDEGDFDQRLTPETQKLRGSGWEMSCEDVWSPAATVWLQPSLSQRLISTDVCMLLVRTKDTSNPANVGQQSQTQREGPRTWRDKQNHIQKLDFHLRIFDADLAFSSWRESMGSRFLN